MSRNQRLTFLGIAALIAVVAIAVLAFGGDDTSDQADNPPSATATATPAATEDSASTTTPTPTSTPTPKPQPPLLAAGTVKKLSYKEGETVTFRVRHDQPEEVHVHGYDIKRELEPNRTETISFKAGITGIFEVELEQSAQQLAELRVDPE